MGVCGGRRLAMAVVLAAVLVARYFRKGGGLAMLRMMNEPIGEHHGHGQPAAAAHPH